MQAAPPVDPPLPEVLGVTLRYKTRDRLVTHSISEAILIGNRILLLSPHPGQVKAEINSLPRAGARTEACKDLEDRIDGMLVSDPVEGRDAAPAL